MKIKDAVAIVTGGAQGIGEKLCCDLLELGGKVSILDINVEKGLHLKAKLEKQYGTEAVMFVPCDVTSSSQMKDAFRRTKERFGAINIVCNNAGIAPESEAEMWEKVIDVNLKGVVCGTMLAIQYMGQSYGGEGGVIVNVASMAGILPMGSKKSIYTATKYAVVGFSRSLEDLKEKEGIRVNCICPSFTETQMTQFKDPEKFKRSAPKLANLAVKIGMIKPELVAKGMIQLIENDDCNAAVMRVTKMRGIDFMNYKRSKL